MITWALAYQAESCCCKLASTSAVPDGPTRDQEESPKWLDVGSHVHESHDDDSEIAARCGAILETRLCNIGASDGALIGGSWVALPGLDYCPWQGKLDEVILQQISLLVEEWQERVEKRRFGANLV